MAGDLDVLQVKLLAAVEQVRQPIRLEPDPAKDAVLSLVCHEPDEGQL